MRCSISILFVAAVLSALPVSQAHARSEVMPGPVTGDVLEILDGDTLAVRVHVWIGQSIETHVRLAGIDAPEIKGKCPFERNRAAAARQELAKMLQNKKVTLNDIQYEKYAGRVMATVSTLDGVSINQHMIDIGLARPYGGEKRQPWCRQT